MSADATLNVRLDRNLKMRGDAVLAREGVSVSAAVRDLYRYLDSHQAMPSWVRPGEGTDVYERRRRGIRELAGIVSLSEDFDAKELKRERLAGCEF